MLLRDQPAKFMPFKYREGVIRSHLHTEDNSPWFVLKDICAALRITNPSYVASKLKPEYIIKHRLSTSSGLQRVMWVSLAGVKQLINLNKNSESLEFLQWLTSSYLVVAKCFVNGDGDGVDSQERQQGYVFKDPVVIERATLDKMLQVLNELTQQGVYSPR